MQLDEIGGIPAGIVDVWADQGSRPEAKYTWDLTRNDNLLWNGRYKPKYVDKMLLHFTIQ